MAVNPDRLSDSELRMHLERRGVELGPIQDTTRTVYRRMLAKRLREERMRQDLPNKRRRVEESPVLPSKKSNSHKHKIRSQSPRFQNSRQNQPPPAPMTSGLGQSRRVPKLAVESPVLSFEQQYDDDDDGGNGFVFIGGSSLQTSYSSPGMGSSYVDHKFGHEGLRLSRSDPAENHSDEDEGIMATAPPYEQVHDSKLAEESSNMEIGGSPQLGRKPLHRERSGSGQWIGNFVKEKVQKIVSSVSSLLTSSNNSPVRRPVQRNPSGRVFHNSDSVEVGGEIEIGDGGIDDHDGEERSPEPSAPPFPPMVEEAGTRYDWELLPSDVEICHRPNGTKWQLGKGGFGEVFKGIKDGVDEVAVKVIKLESHRQGSIEEFKREIDLISKLRHRHILQFYGACIQLPNLYMVTELMQSDLFSALRKDARYFWSGVYGKEVSIGIATGIHYLHSRRPPIVHRDIKSPNVLLMDGLAKIADVGIARAKMSSDMTAQRGFTIAWAAPEVIYRKRATEKIDIWSFGIMLWEIVTGRPPPTGRLSMPNTAPQELQLMFRHCTDENPVHRPAAGDILITLKHMK